MISTSLHVTLFVPSLVVGGVARVMFAIAKGLAERGFAVDLLVINARGELTGSVPDNVRLIDLGSRTLVTALPGLVRYLKNERPDLLIAAKRLAVLLALISKKCFCRNVRTWVRQDNTFSMEIEHAGRHHRMILKLIQRLLPSADEVIAVSAGVAQDLERHVPRLAGTVRLIPNPVLHDDIAAKAAMPVDHPWFNDPEVPVILAAGRLVREKDFSTLVRAFVLVLQSVPARLVILGPGFQQHGLAALAQELGVAHAVDLPGFVPNPFSYMSKASVFVLSSIYEGLGMVLIEAMACGTPVVSTDCPHGPREVLEDGKWGRLVPVGDARALAHAITETLRHPTAPPDLLASRSRAFSIERCLDRHLDIMAGASRILSP